MLRLLLAAAAAAPAVALAQPPAAQQIAAAVLPLPAEFRATATVLGYPADAWGKLAILRTGAGPYVCLAADPKASQFHVACYHRALELFMARGRALRVQGVTGERVDSVRFAEVKAGTLKMPAQAAALYSLTGGSFDPASGTAPGARALYVVYMPGATPESTGIPAQPAPGKPWLMFPGTPKAHIMFVPSM
jgi:hypothetical protein